MHWSGMPTFFVTINPADVYSPLFCKLAGLGDVNMDITNPVLPGYFERRQYLARNPAAGARFFHAIMRAFFEVIVDMSDPDGGLFGKVEAYYGTIEAQGRGSLHCHMLIWVSGGLGPERLREQMAKSETRKAEIVDYIEEMVRTGRSTDHEVVPPEDVEFVKRPPGEPHPCTLRCPHPNDPEFEEEWKHQRIWLILDCNYHIHSQTCWKYLKTGEPKDNEHCRMRIDGTTREMTVIDPETGSILLQRFHPFINNWNEVISMLVRSNMDIKFIGSGKGAKALIYYVTDYITKASLPTHVAFSALQHVIEILKEEPIVPKDGETEEEAIERRGRLLCVKACNTLVGNQELSGQQVMMNLLGLGDGDGDHFTSHKYKIVSWLSLVGWIRAQEQRRQEGNSIVQREVPEVSVNPATDDESEESNDEHIQCEEVQTDEKHDYNSSDTSKDDDDIIIDLGQEESDDALSPQSQLTDYRLRPLAMTEIPVYWYLASTEKDTKTQDENRKRKRDVDEDGRMLPLRRGQEPSSREEFLEGHPQRDTHQIHMRRRLLVPVLLGPTIPARGDLDQEVTEEYARTALTLFKPWRTLDDLLPMGSTWGEEYHRHEFNQRSKEVLDNMNCLHECRDAWNEYSRLRREGVIKTDLINDELIVDTVDNQEADEEDFMAVVEDLAPDLLSDEVDRSQVLQAYEDSRKGAEVRAAMVAAQKAGFHQYGLDEANVLKADTAVRSQVGSEKVLGKQRSAITRLQKELQADRFTVALSVDLEEDVVSKSRVLTVGEAAAENGDGPAMAGVVHQEDLRTESEKAVEEIAKEVAAEYGLNDDQYRAVIRVARSMDDDGDEQLVMYIGGAGGTGKTRVIDAITQVFERMGCAERLRKAAPTGVAARLIGGSTIHSLLNLSTRQGMSTAKLAKMQHVWKSATHVCFDEVSMCGATLMSTISTQLGNLRGSSKPFGGLHMIFSGDLTQLSPVGNKPLWDKTGNTKQSRVEKATTAAASTKGQKGAHGRGLWLLVNEVVLLKENFRAQKDPEFIGMVERIRNGHGRAADWSVLRG